MATKTNEMRLKAISIVREGSYMGSYGTVDPTKPLRCTVEVQGPMGKTELNFPPETSDKIVALIANELAEQSKRVAAEMTAQFFDAAALPAPGAKS